jgi:hypothetical protein
MSRGERAAVRGVLSTLKPRLSVEIGSAEGACLQELARYSGEVHSFDVTPPRLAQGENVVLHTGDSHELLPAFLAELAEQGRTVDFAIVDGDHSPEGVRRDVEDLLDSPAVLDTVILVHDTANELVRSGLDAVPFGAWPKVAHVELDWVPGRLFAEPALRNELWFGLGLVVTRSAEGRYDGRPVYEPRFHPSAPLLAEIRAIVTARELDPPRVGSARQEAEALRVHELRHRVWELETRLWELENAPGGLPADELQRTLADAVADRQRAAAALSAVTGSASWRMTEPLRALKRLATRRRAG